MFQTMKAARPPGTKAALDLQDLPVSLGGDQAQFRPLALQYSVSSDRGAMHDLCDLAGFYTSDVADSFDPLKHADGGVPGRGVDLRLEGVS